MKLINKNQCWNCNFSVRFLLKYPKNYNLDLLYEKCIINLQTESQINVIK